MRQVRLRVFDYEDRGLYEKAARVIQTCKRILQPKWEAEQPQLDPNYHM